MPHVPKVGSRLAPTVCGPVVVTVSTAVELELMLDGETPQVLSAGKPMHGPKMTAAALDCSPPGTFNVALWPGITETESGLTEKVKSVPLTTTCTLSELADGYCVSPL